MSTTYNSKGFHLIHTPNATREDFRDAVLVGPPDWKPWKVLDKIPREKRLQVDMACWDHENYLRLVGTATLSREEILTRAREVTKLFRGMPQKVWEMPLPKMVFGQHYPGWDKHPGVTVRNDRVPILLFNDRIMNALNRISTFWLGLEEKERQLLLTLKNSAPFFQSRCEGFAFVEMWTSTVRPAQALDAAKVLADFVGLELEVLPDTPVGLGLVLRHKVDERGKVACVEILKWGQTEVLAEIAHGIADELGRIQICDLIFVGDVNKVPSWQEAVKEAHKMGLWEDPKEHHARPVAVV